METSVMISVVMPTYNTPVEMLREAVDSILKQTYGNFEFIIIDDGSSNDSDAYLKSLTDERVRIIRNPVNIGITKSLNIGLKNARGKYIARMDADDISMPTRFEKQLAYMEKHPNVLICGTRNTFLIQNGDQWEVKNDNKRRRRDRHMDMEWYRITALFTYPGPVHPSVFISRKAVDRFNLFYDESLAYAQDYDLYVRASKAGDICTLDEALLCCRHHAGRISQARKNEQARFDQITQRKLLEELLGDVSDEELDFFYTYSRSEYSSKVISRQVKEAYGRLTEANQSKGIYNQRKLKRYIDEKILKRLIWQTFTADMTKTEKAKLFFMYLPVSSAVKAVMESILVKLRNQAG